MDFLEFAPPTLPLKLRAGTVDVALLQPSAATDMGKKLYRQIFRETARVLKRKGQFLVFTSRSERLPDTSQNYFEIDDAEKGGDGVTYYLLTRKARKKKKKKVQDDKDEIQQPRQKVLGFTLNELEDALED